MALTRDRYEATFGSHKIELVRNNWDKTLSLMIDGACVAREQRLFPKDVTLRAEFEDGGEMHTLVARQETRPLRGVPIGTSDRVEVDGRPLALRKTT